MALWTHHLRPSIAHHACDKARHGPAGVQGTGLCSTACARPLLAAAAAAAVRWRCVAAAAVCDGGVCSAAVCVAALAWSPGRGVRTGLMSAVGESSVSSLTLSLHRY